MEVDLASCILLRGMVNSKPVVMKESKRILANIPQFIVMVKKTEHSMECFQHVPTIKISQVKVTRFGHPFGKLLLIESEE